MSPTHPPTLCMPACALVYACVYLFCPQRFPQIGSELFPDVVRQLWGSIAQQEWLDLSQLCRCVSEWVRR